MVLVPGGREDEGPDLDEEINYSVKINFTPPDVLLLTIKFKRNLTLTERILLVKVEVRVNVRVLVMMRRHIEHLQPGSRVGRHRRHPLRVKPLSSEPLCITQLRTHLRSSQCHPLPLQMVQPRMEGCEVVRRPGYVGESDRSMSGKVLHGVGRGV